MYASLVQWARLVQSASDLLLICLLIQGVACTKTHPLELVC